MLCAVCCVWVILQNHERCWLHTQLFSSLCTDGTYRWGVGGISDQFVCFRRRCPIKRISWSPALALFEAIVCSVRDTYGMRQDAPLPEGEEERGEGEKEGSRWGNGNCGRCQRKTGRRRVKAVTIPHTLSSSTNPRESYQQGKVFSRPFFFFVKR